VYEPAKLVREDLMETLDRVDRAAKVEIPAKEVLEIDCALALLTTHLEEGGDPIGADEVRGLKKRLLGRCAPEGMPRVDTNGSV
jgi:hypothetical protein